MARSPQSDPRRPIRALLLLAVPLAMWEASVHMEAKAKSRTIAETVPQPGRSGYASSGICKACHPSQYASWYRGYHRTMTQYATPEAVRGDFSDIVLEGGGYDAHLYRDRDDFMAGMVDPLWRYEVDFGQRPPPMQGETVPRVERRVSMVTGSHHMQAYWVPSNVGNGQLSLPFTYLFEDQRWVPRSEVFLHPPEGRHQEQVWNVSCITCHSTAGQPGARVGGKATQTKVAEMGIACESCHGPGEGHVAAHQNPIHRYWAHLTKEKDPTIVNPNRLAAGSASEICGQCHALTELSEDIYLGDGKRYVPGDELEKTQPLLRPLHSTPLLERHVKEDPGYFRNYFWADGTIRVSSRDMSGMIESKCMSGGKLSCGSCHSIHESDPVNLLAENKDGDEACLGCHAKIGEAKEKHTHHKAQSPGGRCYNCHMPYTVYGLLKAIRNHRIDSPHVTGKSGGSERPNACNLCHLDRSLAWTAGQLARWYGQTAPADLSDETPAAVAWLLSGDAVLRAVAAWHFGWEGATAASPAVDLVPYLVAALDDPYAAVRYVAARSVRRLVPGSKFDYLASEEDRQAARGEILERWFSQLSRCERCTKDPDLSAIDAAIDRSIEARDETPVQAME